MALKTHKSEGEMQFWNDILVTDAPVENKRPRDSHNFETNLVVLGIGVICIVLLFKLWKSEQQALPDEKAQRSSNQSGNDE